MTSYGSTLLACGGIFALSFVAIWAFLVCGTLARSKCPTSVNQFCPVCLRWLDAEVETAADPAIRGFHFSQRSRWRRGLYGLRPAPGSRWESTHVPSSELVKRSDGKPV
jgi:hypothetical protein